jgi:hypothetical protein
MKTKIKNDQTNPLGACSTDTHPRKLYEVTVHRTDYYQVRIRIEAQCQEEAEKQAEKTARRQKQSEWELGDRDLYAFSVQVVQEGGKDND